MSTCYVFPFVGFSHVDESLWFQSIWPDNIFTSLKAKLPIVTDSYSWLFQHKIRSKIHSEVRQQLTKLLVGNSFLIDLCLNKKVIQSWLMNFGLKEKFSVAIKLHWKERSQKSWDSSGLILWIHLSTENDGRSDIFSTFCQWLWEP